MFNFHIIVIVMYEQTKLMHLFNAIASMILVVKNDLIYIWISPIRVIPPNSIGFLDA